MGLGTGEILKKEITPAGKISLQHGISLDAFVSTNTQITFPEHSPSCFQPEENTT